MAARAVVDLHCHTSASFDSLSDPVAVARTAASRGITHLAITDHPTPKTLGYTLRSHGCLHSS